MAQSQGLAGLHCRHRRLYQWRRRLAGLAVRCAVPAHLLAIAELLGVRRCVSAASGATPGNIAWYQSHPGGPARGELQLISARLIPAGTVSVSRPPAV